LVRSRLRLFLGVSILCSSEASSEEGGAAAEVDDDVVDAEAGSAGRAAEDDVAGSAGGAAEDVVVDGVNSFGSISLTSFLLGVSILCSSEASSEEGGAAAEVDDDVVDAEALLIDVHGYPTTNSE
jgi:hypothetical protein